MVILASSGIICAMTKKMRVSVIWLFCLIAICTCYIVWYNDPMTSHNNHDTNPCEIEIIILYIPCS